MTFRIVHSPQKDYTPTEIGVFLLYFPDDFETRQRFYVVMWLDTYPLGEGPRSLDDLDAFVTSIRLEPLARFGLVDRTARSVTGSFEKMLGGRLTDVELLPFESRIPGTMKWKAVAPQLGGKPIGLPTKILAEFPPGWALMVTVVGTADNDAVARSLLSTLRTTSDPECFWPVYRNMMKAAGQERHAIENERKFREAAAAGDPKALTLNVGVGGGLTIFFDNNGQLRPCHTFRIDGQWVPGGEPGLLVTEDRRSAVGVEFLSPHRLKDLGY